VEVQSSDLPVHCVLLHVSKGSDIREQVFQLAVAERWVLLELARRGTSLEEVFHKLTKAES
jgi:hypothetical protein